MAIPNITDNHKGTMSEDEPFLRALLAHPHDRVTKLVYADWLDDRADPRAGFLRLQAQLAEMPTDHADRPVLRKHLLEQQTSLPPWWVAIAGGLRASSSDDRMIGPRIEEAARRLGHPAKRTDEEGYELEITAAATSGLTGAVAYLESRSKWRDRFHDIHYHLRLRDPSGREVAWEPKTYNPFFGCRDQFLEWYGDEVIFVYEEKHETYIARFGFDTPAKYRDIETYWVLDGREIGYRSWRETTVSRLSVPDLEPLPQLSEFGAAERELLPKATWE